MNSPENNRSPAGTKLEWDAEKMRFRNSTEANALVNPPARAGWEI